MIYDKIENCGNYKGISPLLDKALDFLATMDLDKKEAGKYEIDGTNLFYMVQDYTTIPEDNGKYESHRDYIDIQLLLSGNEYIRSAPYEGQRTTVEYNSEKDIELFQLSDGYDLLLKRGMFALLMPTELHAPKIMVNREECVRKVVIKIKK